MNPPPAESMPLDHLTYAGRDWIDTAHMAAILRSCQPPEWGRLLTPLADQIECYAIERASQ